VDLQANTLSGTTYTTNMDVFAARTSNINLYSGHTIEFRSDMGIPFQPYLNKHSLQNVRSQVLAVSGRKMTFISAMMALMMEAVRL
jgi:hypothetical protein